MGWALTSCGNLRDIRVEEIRKGSVSLQPQSSGKMQLSMDARISNPSRRTVTVTQLDFKLRFNGATIAVVSSPNPLRIAKRSNDFQPILLDVQLQNLLLLLGLRKDNMDKLVVSGTLKAKVGLLRKTIDIDEQPASALVPQVENVIAPLFKK
jgi:LEA14-like dessication related protein